MKIIELALYIVQLFFFKAICAVKVFLEYPDVVLPFHPAGHELSAFLLLKLLRYYL